MRSLKKLFDNNRKWAQQVHSENPSFFEKLHESQTPEYLWIGCSDSRVPANQITLLPPGQVFVQRNIANQVVHTDLNCLSVIQYSIDILKIRHVIVCGHYGCGGINAALANTRLGLADNWIRHIQDVKFIHQKHIQSFVDPRIQQDRLCELNVIEQVKNVALTSILQDAWSRHQEVHVHGWIYALKDGLLRDLNTTITNTEEIDDIYQSAVNALYAKQPE